MNHWIILLIAAALEVIWGLSLKATEGYTKLWPSIMNAALVALNVWVFSKAMKGLPAGTAYSVWVGLGSVGVVLGGVVLFGESASLLRMFFIGLIITGVVGLKFATSS
jgi:quaternary ammonium compound-resistance protein SugE